MRVVFQMSTIVAALALAGCGQRGALYLHVVPPLPAKPTVETAPVPEDATSGASATSGEEPISASVGTMLQFSPSLAAPAPASAAPPTR
ncbi:MAG: lipoprotein [Burkholderia sp.]